MIDYDTILERTKEEQAKLTAELTECAQSDAALVIEAIKQKGKIIDEEKRIIDCNVYGGSLNTSRFFYEVLNFSEIYNTVIFRETEKSKLKNIYEEIFVNKIFESVNQFVKEFKVEKGKGGLLTFSLTLGDNREVTKGLVDV